MNAFRFFIAGLLITLGGFSMAAAPPNDQFANAISQSGNFWLTTGTLHESTSEANEPVLHGFPNGHTVWWKWTAPSGGRFRVRTWGSEADVILGLYRGASLDTLRLVSYNSSYHNRANSGEATVDAQAGVTYHIQVLGTDYLSPLSVNDALLPSRIQVSLTPVSGVPWTAPNDNFASATPLSGTTAEVTASNSLAGGETGEPLTIAGNAGNSIWFSWTAPSTGAWCIDTRQGDYDSIVAVYTGNAVNSLTRIDYTFDGDDSGPAVGGGRLNFRATSGTTYRIQLQGAVVNSLAEYGVCRMFLLPVTPPANDHFASAEALSGTAPSGEGWTTFATREDGEPASAVDGSKTIWWNWTVPATGIMAVVQMEGTVEPFIGNSVAALAAPPFDPRSGTRNTLGAVTYFYQVTAGTVLRLRGASGGGLVRFTLRLFQPPAHDDFANRLLLSGGTPSNTTDLEFASWQSNEPDIDGLGPQTVWYRWIAPSTGRFSFETMNSGVFHRVAVFTGSALNALTKVGEEKLGSNGTVYGRVYLNATSGTEYAIQIRREDNRNATATLGIHPVVPPANDNFAAAINMTGSAWTTTGSNVDATFENNEPLTTLSDGSAFSTVWWKWTAPAAGLYRVTNAGSSFNSVLSIYTGTSFPLTRVAQDQGAGWNSSGSIFLQAAAGTQYFFQVDGQFFGEGTVKLSLAPATAPPNDAFASRLVVSGASTNVIGTVTSATAEAGEPSAGVGRSVWYEWTAPASGRAYFTVTGNRFSPAFGLYTGTAVNALTPFVSGGSGAPNASEQTFFIGSNVSSGTSYKILVGGTPTENGIFNLGISMAGAAPANNAFASRTALTGSNLRVSTDNEGATAEAGEPIHAGIAAAHSVWWEWTAPSTGPVSLDTNSSTGQPRLAVYTGTAVNALASVASAVNASPFTSLTFNGVSGTKYVIAADSTERTRGLIVLNLLSNAAAPANDHFANSTILTTDQAEALSYPRGATAEASEPAPGGRAAAKSLWWAWTPQTTRRARIWMETESNDLSARLAVYRGNALNSLTPIMAQTGDGRFGRLEFDALAGETYRIVLDTPSVAADPGWVKVGVVPVNGTSDNAYLISPTTGIISTSTTGAYEAEVTQNPTAHRRLWWAWTPDVCARMEWRAIAPEGSGTTISVSTGATAQPVPGLGEVSATFDVVPDVTYFFSVSTLAPGPVQVHLREAPQQAPPSNDRPHLPLPMSGTSWSIPVTLGTETMDRLYWSWTAPAAGVCEVKLDGTLAQADAILAHADGLSDIVAGASRTNGGAPVLRLSSTAGQKWTFVSKSTLRRIRSATLSLVSPAPGPAPANDNFQSAQSLSPGWTSVNGDITHASCQPLEPNHIGVNDSGGLPYPPGRSVWYDWTPSVTGPVTLRLQSAASLAMQIYRGRTRQQWLTDGHLNVGSPSFTANVVAGEMYHIAVATRPYEESTAPFTLGLGAAAANDLFINAATLSGPPATQSVESTGATAETGEPGYSTSFNLSKGSLWWKWTAPSTGAIHLDTFGSEYDTVLTVFTSDPPTLQSIIAENDNASTLPGTGVSAVSFHAVSGQIYYIRLNRAPNETKESGIAKLNLSTTPTTADPWQRWLASKPGLTGPNATELGDPDFDGTSNLLELVFGTNPESASRGRISASIIPQGFQVDALIDRAALAGLRGATSLDLVWQVSYDLGTWLPGPVSQTVGNEGLLTRIRIILPQNGPRFARLVVRKTH